MEELMKLTDVWGQERWVQVEVEEPAPEEKEPAGEVMADVDGAEQLLDQSALEQPEDPERSEELARLALWIAGRPHPARLVGRVEAVKARGLCLLGNARRLIGDFAHAEESLRRAAYHLLAPPESRERGFYAWMLALLRRDQGRGSDAIGLFWRAARIFGEAGERLEEGECLADLGFLFLQRGEPTRAVFPLRGAREALEGRGRPALLERVRRALSDVDLNDDSSGGHGGPGFSERSSTMDTLETKHEEVTVHKPVEELEVDSMRLPPRPPDGQTLRPRRCSSGSRPSGCRTP